MKTTRMACTNPASIYFIFAALLILKTLIMKKFEFDPMIVDYSPDSSKSFELYIAEPSLQGHIDIMSNDKLIQLLDEYRKYKTEGEFAQIPLLDGLYTNFKKQLKNEYKWKAFPVIFSLVYEKIAYLWANEIIDKKN